MAISNITEFRSGHHLNNLTSGDFCDVMNGKLSSRCAPLRVMQPVAIKLQLFKNILFEYSNKTVKSQSTFHFETFDLY